MRTIAAFIIAAIATGSIAFGLRYLLARAYLSYHAQLTGLSWDEIPPRYQAVILGMLKMVGVGMLVFGVALLWLLRPLLQGESWASWAIASLVGTQGGLSLYITLALRRVNPEAQTNVLASSAGLLLALVALALAQRGS